MPIQRECTIMRAEKLNPFAWSLTLDAGELARAALPGQFIHVKCGDSRLLRRPISICDTDGNCLRMVFEVRGEGTAWLSRRHTDETLDVLGPLGHGFDLSGRKLLAVGGGIGVPPILNVVRHCKGEAHAILGFRSVDRAMLLDEFRAASSTVSVASDDGSIGTHGFVDALVREKLKGERDVAGVLACGPRPMLRAVAKAAAEAGVPCQVSMEERMGCGVGACLVCACKMADGAYRHVCKDGPVFRAEEVDWDE
ncbi:MAG: dihydroorotate dehydrogenase electron transfer subunit [Intestinimonas sp.]|jgi:dihydroorotate dehydrogenase electron transfer subunit|nr:dihydroorotate dehydrogenase electron transfer subunit [Intestinimonas sp.]